MTKKRIKAYIIDLIIHSLIFAPVLIFLAFTRSHKHTLDYLAFIFYFYSLIALGFLLLKDVINGQSFGKKFARIKIIDKRTGGTPSVFKIALRNYINLMFTPVDIIFLWTNRSFGDMIANTTITEINLT